MRLFSKENIIEDYFRDVLSSVFQLPGAISIGVLRLEAGTFFDWHSAPRKQFVLVISGRIEIKSGDGENRILGPGKILIAADDLGRGHQTQVLDNQPAVIICVPTPKTVYEGWGLPATCKPEYSGVANVFTIPENPLF